MRPTGSPDPGDSRQPANSSPERRAPRAMDREPVHLDVLAEGVRDQIDAVPRGAQGPDPVEHGKRRPPRPEERLRRHHEDAQLLTFHRGHDP